jgi:hypothetical protein
MRTTTIVPTSEYIAFLDELEAFAKSDVLVAA